MPKIFKIITIIFQLGICIASFYDGNIEAGIGWFVAFLACTMLYLVQHENLDPHE